MEKYMLRRSILLSMMSASILFAETGVGVNINEDDLEIEAVLDSRNLAAFQNTSTILQADVNFLNIEGDNQKAKLLGAGVGATNTPEGVRGVELTFGAKMIYSSIDTDDYDSALYDSTFVALPLMAKVRYTFPPLMFHIPPISLEGKVLYAPGALAFGDAETYSEFRFAADIEMIPNVKIYAGYRNIHTEYVEGKDFTFNTGFYGGLKYIY
ncbi:MAG TPA: hypothetical protein EYM49_07840 [Campylobacterales bacterium]|nr:hypothetical protein [Campylobacterales bacterium]